jgi:prephenate dehydrogenase
MTEVDGGFARVGIVGLGLIGGSIGLATRRACPDAEIVGIDLDAAAVRGAVACGAAHRASADIAEVRDADLIVLAAPVRANLVALDLVCRHARPSAIVTDVGSTKRVIVDAARSLGRLVAFVGGHPLAGASHGGIAHARADLFAGRPWVLTPDGEDADGAVGRVEAFVGALGARPHRMTAEEHDRVMACVSHLPQVVSSALMHVAGGRAGEAGLALAGEGLADTTRLADSPGDIWRDICETNADHIRPALLQLITTLATLADDLPAANLDSLFAAARSWRSKMRLT